MAQPTGQDRHHLFLVPFGDEDEGRSSGATIEIFVAAADRHVGIAGVEIDRQGTGRVAQVPDHDDALLLRRLRDGLHVVQITRLVVGLGNQQCCHVIIEVRYQVGCGDHLMPD